MSGHSKWSSIKHKKAIADSRRGQSFTKLANLVALAARRGADPEMNFSLRLAIQKAKAANMPLANIERAIKRGSGQLGGAQMEEIVYEGYGPGGAAIMIEVATDNRNRTAADVRSTLSKHGGRMAEAGAVAYQFSQKGIIRIQAADAEAAALAAIDAGASDVEPEGDELVAYTAAADLDAVRKSLAAAGYEASTAELAFIPHSTVTVDDEKVAGTLMKLLDILDELDDVTATYANFEFTPEIAEKL